MKIIWSPLAVDRASEIAEYIALDKPLAAEKWIIAVFSKVEQLASSPEIGRVVPEIGNDQFRELIYGNYRINRAIMQVLNLCLTFCFIFFGFISLYYTQEMVVSGIGKAFLVFIALFWLLRAIEQFIFFDYKHPGSIVIVILCLAGILLYIYPLF